MDSDHVAALRWKGYYDVGLQQYNTQARGRWRDVDAELRRSGRPGCDRARGHPRDAPRCTGARRRATRRVDSRG